MQDASPPTHPPRAEITRRAVRGAMTVVGRGFVIRALGFVGTLVIARQLAPRDFGVIAVGLSLMSLGTFLSGSGLTAALIKSHAAPTRRQLETLLGFQLAVAVALSLVLTGVALVLGSRDVQIVAIIVWTTPFIALRAPRSVFLERQLRYGPAAAADVFETALYQVVAIGGVVFGAGVWAVAAASIVRGVGGTAFLFWRVPEAGVRPRIHGRSLKAMVPFGLKFQAPWAIEIGRFNAFNAVVVGLGTLVTLGVWSLTVRLLQPVQLVQEALGRVAFAALVRVTSDRDDVAVLQRSMRIVSLGLGAGLVLLVAAAPAGIPLILGDDWKDAAVAVPGAALALLLTGPLRISLTPFLYATDRARVVLVSTSIAALAGVLLAAAGAHWFEITGVAVAVALAAIFEVLIAELLIWRELGISVSRPTLVPATIAIVAGGVGLAASAALGNDIVAALVAPVLAVAAFVVGCGLFARGTLDMIIRLVRRGMKSPEEDALAADGAVAGP